MGNPGNANPAQETPSDVATVVARNDDDDRKEVENVHNDVEAFGIVGLGTDDNYIKAKANIEVSPQANDDSTDDEESSPASRPNRLSSLESPILSAPPVPVRVSLNPQQGGGAVAARGSDMSAHKVRKQELKDHLEAVRLAAKQSEPLPAARPPAVPPPAACPPNERRRSSTSSNVLLDAVAQLTPPGGGDGGHRRSSEIVPEAFLIEDPIAVKAERVQSHRSLDPAQPWWKRRRLLVLAIVILALIAGLAAAISVAASSESSPANQAVGVAETAAPSTIWPSLAPSERPSQFPSEAPTSCVLKIQDDVQDLELRTLDSRFPIVVYQDRHAVAVTNTGLVAFFHLRNGETWTMTDGFQPDHDGSSPAVSLFGVYAIIGYPMAATEAGEQAGVAYIFRKQKNSGKWNQIAGPLVPESGGEELARFGAAVSMSTNYAVVGAPNEHNSSGAVYIYTRVDRDWYYSERIAPSDLCEGANFGSKIEGDKDTIAITSNCHESIYLYSEDNIFGNFKPTQDPFAVSDDVEFIGDVGMSTGSLAILTNTGGVYIYERAGKGKPFRNVQYFNASYYDDWFSYSLSIDRDILAVGGNGVADDSQVYIWIKDDNGHWEKSLTLDSSLVNEPLSHFGFKVAIQNRVLLTASSDEVYSHNITHCTPTGSGKLSKGPTL